MKTSTLAGYGSGAYGKDLVYGLVSTFLMIYFTDTAMISPLFLGFLFLGARIFDAAIDPFMGWLVDRTRSRWGKFRPWIAVGTLLNAGVLIALFTVPASVTSGREMWAAILYVAWGTTYTLMDIPFWSMIPALTTNPRQRETVAVVPRVCASLGFFTVATGGLALVKMLGGDSTAQGYSLLAMIVGIAFIATSALTVLTAKEEIQVPGQNHSLGDLFRILARNDQALTVSLVMILFNTVTYLTTGLGLYYFKYNLGNEMLFSTFALVVGVAQVLAMLLFPWLAKKLGRRRVFALSVGLPVLGYLAFLAVGWLGWKADAVQMALGFVLFLGFGLSQVLGTVMLADTVDYGEKKLGFRNEGIIFSLQPFIVKFASAFSGFLVGAGLSVLAFVPNQVQSAGTLAGISFLMFMVPIFGLALSALAYKFWYKLD